MSYEGPLVVAGNQSRALAPELFRALDFDEIDFVGGAGEYTYDNGTITVTVVNESWSNSAMQAGFGALLGAAGGGWFGALIGGAGGFLGSFTYSWDWSQQPPSGS